MKAKSLLFLVLMAFGSEEALAQEQSYGTWSFGRSRVREVSAYTWIERNAGTLPLSLGYLGVYPAPMDDAAMRVNIDSAVKAWAGALNGNPYWNYPSPDVVFSAQPVVRVIVDASVQRSYAIPESHEIRLSPMYLNAQDPNSYRVILHEMGHMFGLADTYWEPGLQTPINQPPGIMNYCYAYDEPQADDIAGANAVYEYMNGRGPFCRGIYAPGGAYENPNQIAFCAPA